MASGELVLHTRRFTPILGLCLAAQSIMEVSAALLEEEGFQYALAYRMSQDHLELLFGRIRGMGGYNNNPNAVQLQRAMRRLTLHNFITPSAAANCIPQDADGECDGLFRIRRPSPQGPGQVEEMPAAVQHALLQDMGSEFAMNCVAYISGYVCRKLRESGAVRCADCFGALVSNDDDPPPQHVLGLVGVRDNGGLLVPSASTYAIVSAAERHLTALKKCETMRLPNLSLSIQHSVLSHFMTSRSHELFPGVQEHMYEPRVDECHAILLLKQIVARYLRVRLHSYGRSVTVSGLRSAHLRQKFNKMVLFSNV